MKWKKIKEMNGMRALTQEENNVRAYDKDNNVITCSYCEKPAGIGFESKDYSIRYCSDHYFSEDSNDFSKKENFDLDNTWVVDLRADE